MSRFLLFILLLFPIPFLSAQISPEDVTIVRDQWGVPHIYGKTDAATAMGLAWAHAEDNFYDMQTNLLISRGRLGEVDGPEGAQLDFVVKFTGMQEMVREKYQTDVSNDFKKVLEGYCQGINAYAEAHPEELRLKGLLPITPYDILVGYSASMSLMSGLPYPLISILEGRPDDLGPFQLDGTGSNAFAFNSSKTADGQVYVCNNSHQPLDGNLAWYEAHLVSDEGWNTMGALFPGGVSIFTGATQDLAWAHTVNPSDFVDVYQLKMHPKNKLQYRFDGEYKTLEEKKIKLKVKLGPIKLTVKKKAWWSIYGATVKGKDGNYYSFRFSANMGVKAAEQWYRMNKARNFSEFYQCLEMGGLASTNIVYGDASDTIFYIDNGNFPFRDRAYDWREVVPGDTSATLWEDFHSTEELVQVLQPLSGYVYNTNNSPFQSSGPLDNPDPRDYDPTLGNYQYPNNRSLRFEELVSSFEKVSWQDFLRIKYDQQYPDSMYIYFMTNAEDLFNLDADEFPEIREEIELLRNWDKRGNVDSRAAAISLVTMHYLFQKINQRHEFFKQNRISHEEIAESIADAQKHFKKHFGTSNVTLGEVQRLVRGDNDYPLSGLEDQIASMRSVKWKNGRLRAFLGDSFIQLVRFSEKGIQIRSSVNFGASNRKESPHYDDQVELHLNKQTKEMRFEKDWIMERAEKVYHPGQEHQEEKKASN